MKKLLTTLFMAVLAVSAFADITVQTITPTVYHEGSCERAGTIRFIVDNDTDYQNASSTNFILIRVQLTDSAVFCHDLDGVDDGDSNWVNIEVDGTYWTSGDVVARAAAGSPYLYIKVCDAPSALPNSAVPAWFIVGNTTSVNPAASEPFTPNALCVNYTGTPEFTANDFHLISIQDFIVAEDCLDNDATNGVWLGTSYDPANPAIAYGGPEYSNNFVPNSDCDKNGNDLYSAPVQLCPCYTSEIVDQQTVYECEDLYRVGTLVLDTDQCDVWIEEDEIGMVPAGSMITLTVVDEEGNPLSTVDDGVYFAGTYTNYLSVYNATELTLGVPTAVAWDLNTELEYSMYNDATLDNSTCVAMGNYCTDTYSLYQSVSYEVLTDSSSVIAQLQLDNIMLARHTTDGEITAYIRVSWAPYPCGAGGFVDLPYGLDFELCPDEAVVEEYYPEYLYYSYFPGEEGGWWQGLAVTNTSFFYDNIVHYYATDQDVTVYLWFLEADGDIYGYEWGTLPASGIVAMAMQDGSGTTITPELLVGDDAAFGDERYWVIAKGTPTVPNTYIAIDGFGMLGNFTEAQGFLPRIRTEFMDVYKLWN